MQGPTSYFICIAVAWLSRMVECQVTVSIPQSTSTQCENNALCSHYLSITSKQQAQLEMLTKKVREIEDLLNKTIIGKEEDQVVSGLTTSYVRWGRTVCPSTSLLLYEGIAGNSYYNHAGGGSNYLCLPMDPEWPDNIVPGFQSQSYIYGVEYEYPMKSNPLHDYDAPCAVCQVNGRSHVKMIPAKRTCPDGWTKEFSGRLVAESSAHTKSTYECLDESAEARNGSSPNVNGGLFYAVGGDCGYSLPCPPYIDGYQLSCVVCTK